jgi:ribose-phosphate pyrophosphokinase
MIYLNDQLVEFETYPNGETRMPPPLPWEERGGKIRLAWRSDADLFNLGLWVRQASWNGFYMPDLEIEYMPYSRMDRNPEGRTFSLRTVSAFINALGFRTVEVWEPHSPVTLELLDRSLAVYPTLALFPRVLDSIHFTKDRDVVVFPDAGASTRYEDFAGDFKKIELLKKRDFKTGQIESLDLPPILENVRLDGATCLIVDDLCSYGGTFIKTARLLIGRGAARVFLLVAHLEASALRGDLFSSGLIEGVYSTDSMWRQNEHEVGSPFFPVPYGWQHKGSGSYLRLFTREEWHS